MGLGYRYSGTIREHLTEYTNSYRKAYPSMFDKNGEKPLDVGLYGIEGIRITAYRYEDIQCPDKEENHKEIGEEMFTYTGKTFLTHPNLLKYIDKPIIFVFSAGGIGTDGHGDLRRWHGFNYYVYSPEDFE